MTRSFGLAWGLGVALAAVAAADTAPVVTAHNYFDRLEVKLARPNKPNAHLVLEKSGKAVLRLGSQRTRVDRDAAWRAAGELDVSKSPLKDATWRPFRLSARELTGDTMNANLDDHHVVTFVLGGAAQVTYENLVRDIRNRGADDRPGEPRFKKEILDFSERVIAAIETPTAAPPPPPPVAERKREGIATVLDPSSVAPPSSTVPASAPARRRLLSKGCTGEDVRELQRLLIEAGFTPISKDGKPDGVFGWRTDYQVHLYQESRGLEPDGAVGRKTWTALLSKAPAVTRSK